MAAEGQREGRNEGMELDIHIDFSPLEPLRQFFDDASFEKLRQWYEAEHRRRFRFRYNYSPDVLAKRLLMAIRFGLAVNAKSRIVEIEDRVNETIHGWGMKSREKQMERIIKEAERAARMVEEEPDRMREIDEWLNRYEEWVGSKLTPGIGNASEKVGFGTGKIVELTWRVCETVGGNVGYCLGYGMVLVVNGVYQTIVFVTKKTFEKIKEVGQIDEYTD